MSRPGADRVVQPGCGIASAICCRDEGLAEHLFALLYLVLLFAHELSARSLSDIDTVCNFLYVASTEN
jgi:hypothetical protein